MAPKLFQVNIAVRDMEAMAGFYGRLGIDLPAGPAEWAPHHRSAERGDGTDIDLDSIGFTKLWNAGWGEDPGVVLTFAVPERADVDRVYTELIRAGATEQQPPFDAFWGARYAVLADPEGNAIGLMSPRDDAPRPTSRPETAPLPGP